MGTGLMMPAWAVVLVAGVITGFVGWFGRDLIKRIEGLFEKLEALAEKLDAHVGGDNKAHERITVLETRVDANTHTIQENYNKFHRFQIEMREGATKNYQWLTDKFDSLYKWLNEKFLEIMRRP